MGGEPGSTPSVCTPILNDPWTGPVRHWRLSNVTGETVETDEPLPGRRASGADERVIAGRNANPVDETMYGCAPHPLINALRVQLDAWREAGRPGVTGPMARLLERWLPRHELRATPRPQPDEVVPYWCQVEAVETVIWLLEAGRSAAPDAWAKVQKELDETNARYNEGINRISVKMATGTGKTWVMAMLIAWWSATPAAGEQPQVLVIAPNTTVRDRLAVLRDSTDFIWTGVLGPNGALRRRPRIEIINEQRWFRRREVYDVAGGKPDGEALKYLRAAQTSEERAGRDETDGDVAARLLRDFTARQPILVLNDEGHHCWRTGAEHRRGRRPPAGERRDDAEDRDTAGRWFGILTALQRLGCRGPVIDLSATPFWRNPPDADQSPLFPWTVSNTPLIEAIECGLVKIPIVPTRDDARGATQGGARLLPGHVPGHPGCRRRGETPPHRSETVAVAPGQARPVDRVDGEALPAGGHERAAAADPPPVLIVVTDTIDNANAIWRRIGGRASTLMGHRPGSFRCCRTWKTAGLDWMLRRCWSIRSSTTVLLKAMRSVSGRSRRSSPVLSSRPVLAQDVPSVIEKLQASISALIRDTAGVVPGTPGRQRALRRLGACS